MEEREFKKITIINYIFKLILMGISFISVPITLKFLGNERYGVWQTMLSMVSWISILNIGIPNALRNKVTEYLTKEKYDEIKKYISSSYLVLTFIALLIFIVFIITYNIVDFSSLFNVENIMNSELTISIFIVISGSLVIFITELANSIALGIHKSFWVTLSQVVSSLILLIFMFIFIFKKNNDNNTLIYMALLYILSNIILNILMIVVLSKKNNNYSPHIKYVEKEYFKKVTTMGKNFLILQIVFMMVSATDNFLITIFIGPGSVTNYSILNKIFNIVITLFNILLIQVWSSSAAYYHLGEYDNIKNLLKKLLKISLVIIIVIIFIALAFDYITYIWLGEKLEISNALLISTSIFAIINILTAIFVNIQNGTGNVKSQTYGWILGVCIYVPLSYISCKVFDFGVVGISISKTIAYTCPLIYVSRDVLKMLKNI